MEHSKVLFYPYSGFDLKTPLMQEINEFWFVDIKYRLELPLLISAKLEEESAIKSRVLGLTGTIIQERGHIERLTHKVINKIGNYEKYEKAIISRNDNINNCLEEMELILNEKSVYEIMNLLAGKKFQKI